MARMKPQRRTSVDDIVSDHILSRRLGLVFINPVRLVPVVVGNQAKFDRRVRKLSNPPGSAMSLVCQCTILGTDARLESLRELLLVEEDVWILELLVEPVLELLHTADDSVEVAVARCGPFPSAAAPRLGG